MANLPKWHLEQYLCRAINSRSLLPSSVLRCTSRTVQRRYAQVQSDSTGFRRYDTPMDYLSFSQRIQLALDNGHVNDHGKNRLFLVDGMDPIHRVHYASKERIVTESGVDVTILIGFMRQFFALLSTHPMPTHCIVAFDAPGPGFRQAMYPGYKAHREEKPAEIVASIPLIMKALDSLGVKWVRIHGIEADDALGTLATRFAAEDASVYLFSRDKDFFQILGDNVVFVRGPNRQGQFQLYTSDVFKEEFGIDPEYWVDVLALQGDQADNIPGVFKIGPKRALGLVSVYGHLDDVFEHASEVNSRAVRESLLVPEARNNATFSKELIKIVTNLNLPTVKFDLEKAEIKTPADGGAAFQEFMSRYDEGFTLQRHFENYIIRTLRL